MTTWVDLAGALAPHAPTIGKMLGGLTPVPGGALMGEWAGKLLADKLGVPAEPEAVKAALYVDTGLMVPEHVVDAVSAAEREANAEWEARARIAEAESRTAIESSKNVNASIQSETTAKVAWYHWRHILGYIIGLWYLVPLPGIAYALVTGDVAMVNQITTLLGAMSAFVLGGSALLGVVAYDTSRFKEAIATGAPREPVLPGIKKGLRRS